MLPAAGSYFVILQPCLTLGPTISGVGWDLLTEYFFIIYKMLLLVTWNGSFYILLLTYVHALKHA
jgi:hypothetical protein